MRTAVGVLAAATARRRWRSMALIALVTALAGAVTLTALAGARRTSTVVDRAADAARVADVGVDVAVADRAHLQQVARLPQVADLSAYLFTAVRPAGSDLTAGIDVVGVAPLDDRAFVTMDIPRWREGRPPRPDAADEVAFSTALADRLHKHVGDTVTVEAYRQDQVEAIFGDASGPIRPAGARLTMRLVGIGDPLEAIGATGNEGVTGIIVLSRAAYLAHGVAEPDFRGEPPLTEIGAFRLVVRARLRHGAEDAPAYLRGVFGIYGSDAETTFSEARPDVFHTVADSVRVQAIALLLFALAAGAAGVVAAGQAAAREAIVPLIEDEAPLQAMGLTRWARVAAATLPMTGAVAVGAVVAVVTATVASRWLPRGLAGRLEPNHGMSFDGSIVLGGAALLVVILLARVALASWWVTRAAARRGATTTASSRVVAGLPTVAALGVRLILHPGRGRRAIPTRPTVVAAVVAVAGVVAALVFAGSLDHLTHTPRLYGQDWDAAVTLQTQGAAIAAREEPALVADTRLSAVSRYGLFEASFGSDQRYPGFLLDRRKGQVGPTVLAGRLPSSPDEVALDPGTIAGPGPAVGQTVRIKAGDKAAPFVVVGMLTGDNIGAFVVTADAGERLGPEPSDEGFLVKIRPGADRAAVLTDLRRRFVEVERPEPPDAVANVRNARGFPYALGLFLAVLGVTAAGHLLVTTIRRRRYDVAVTRALGLTARQTRAVTSWQALTVAAVAVVLGIPLGVVVGRWSWTLVSDALRVVASATVPAVPIALAGVGAMAAAVLLSWGPGRTAARIRPAEVLRAE